MKFRLLGLVGTVGLCLVAGPTPAEADYVIRVEQPWADHGHVTRIGPWAMRTASIARARQVFGPPSSTDVVRPGFNGDGDCVQTWGPIGLKAVFTTLGIFPGTCNPGRVLYFATITSRRWQTWRGLRIGDNTSLIRHEPRTTFHGGVWWLATAYRPWGTEPGPEPTVMAIPHNGRISAFRLVVRAQGE